MKDLFILGKPGAIGFEVAFQLSIVSEGVKVLVSVRDPRDPEKRLHQAPFILPTNAVPRAEEKPPPTV